MFTGELVGLSCLAHSCDRQANPVTCCTSPCNVQTAAELLLFYCVLCFWSWRGFQSYFLASFLASFGTRDLRPTWGSAQTYLYQIGWLMQTQRRNLMLCFEEGHSMAMEIGCRSLESRCKSESHRFVTNAWMNHALAFCFEQKMTCLRVLGVLVILWTLELGAFCNTTYFTQTCMNHVFTLCFTIEIYCFVFL